LVGKLVQFAATKSNALAGDLPDQREHWRVDRIGGGEGGGRVQEARTGNAGIGCRRACRLRCTESHIGCALLVPGRDDSDAISGIVERVEKMVELDAGQPEKSINAVCFQPSHNRPAAACADQLAVSDHLSCSRRQSL
jgi:hypothetical protein